MSNADAVLAETGGGDAFILKSLQVIHVAWVEGGSSMKWLATALRGMNLYMKQQDLWKDVSKHSLYYFSLLMQVSSPETRDWKP